MINRTVKNTNKATQQEIGVIQITTPKIVATPFPPLNPANTGNTCPTNAAIPKPSSRVTNSLLSKIKGEKWANKTAIVPLIISINNYYWFIFIYNHIMIIIIKW